MNKYKIILSFFLLLSCEYNDESRQQLNKKEDYSVLHQERAFYPGLGFEKDTLISIVSIYDLKDRNIKDMFIASTTTDESYIVDSLLDLGIYINDTIEIIQVQSRPLQLVKNEFTFFLYGGFDKKNVRYFGNEKEIYIENDTAKIFGYGRVNKSSFDSIGISVNNSLPIYSVVIKEYNYLELFLIGDSTVQFRYLYHWDEY